jgi:uroporphyrinogen decarboxylase
MKTSNNATYTFGLLFLLYMFDYIDRLIIDKILESGYDGLNPLEPQAGMELKKVRDYCGDRLCLLGNIDCMELLPSGTSHQVKGAVKQAIQDAGQGGGLIICSSNTLHPGVNPDNCIAMFQAVKTYGVYH